MAKLTQNGRTKTKLTALGRNTYLLALASFFTDISTEMLYPLLPIFITETLRSSGSILGLIEGVAQASQYIIQGVSGYLSDKFRKRKLVALFGFILSAISKPFIGLATAWPAVLVARTSDRIGAGSRSAPRDALIAASVDDNDRGKAFGLEGIGDNLGAFLGPIVTLLLFFSLHFDIHTIFYLAIIPGLCAVGMAFFVKERASTLRSKTTIDLHVRQYPAAYWKYLFVTGIFGIGNSSNAFLILQTKEKGLSLEATIMVYALFNLGAALISYPSGALSDRFGRKPLLLAAFSIFCLSYAGFAFFPGGMVIAILFVFYSMFQGIFRSVGKSFATDFVSAHLHASAIGWYSMVVGVSQLISSIIAGQLWDTVGHSSVFLFGAGFSLIGVLLLIVLVPKGRFNGGK